MVTNRLPQVHVIFLCTTSDLWRNTNPVLFDQLKAEIEAGGGKFWYMGQRTDFQAERDRQYQELRDFIEKQGHQHDAWEVVTNSEDKTLSVEQKFFAEGVKDLMRQLREGWVGYIDPEITHRDLILAMSDELDLTRNPGSPNKRHGQES
jgi:hypothetical protein